MKKYFILLCCITGMQYCIKAQNAVKLDIAPLSGAKTVILPTLDNLVALIEADDAQYEAMMTKYNYVHYDAAGPHTYHAQGTTEDFLVSRTGKFVDIYFMKVSGDYAKTTEKKFLKNFSYSNYKLLAGGKQSYLFAFKKRRGRQCIL
jgi:hypothetical protein